MDTEQGLYSQVVMIHKKDLDGKNEKEKTEKYNFQYKSARSKCWIDLDHEWLEEIFKTGEPEFYKKLYQINIKGEEMKIYQFFVVLIDNEQIT